MGFFEDLFDFDGDGKVGPDDDLMFLWITQNALAKKREENADDGGFKPPAYPQAKEALKAAAEAETRHKFNKLRRELYVIRIPYDLEQKDKSQEAIQQYKDLLARLEQLEPEDPDSELYCDYMEFHQEIQGFVRDAERIHQILNGEFRDASDPLAVKASEIAELEQELADWEALEPEDCTSEAWDAWALKRDEYESEIEERKEEMDWEQLYASFEAVDHLKVADSSYLNAYAESTKVLEAAQYCVERLEQLVRVARKILDRSIQTAGEYIDPLATARFHLDMEEPEKTSARWNAWKKRIDELKQVQERMDQITAIWVDTF